MTIPCCSREGEVWDAIVSERWPDGAANDLLAHVASCASCRDLATVARSLREDASGMRLDTAPPAAAVVWWRAQLRARQESALAADRPISIAQSLAMASGAGLLLGVLGWMITWARGSMLWKGIDVETARYATTGLSRIDLTNPWVLVPVVLAAVMAIAAPVALYALGDED